MMPMSRDMELHETSVDKFSCLECGKLFSKRKYLLEHERWHTTEMPYACHLCPAKFRRKYYMEVHVRGHTGEKPYKCEVCEQSFSRLHSRKRHMHRVHRDAELKDVTCRDIEKEAVMRNSPPLLLSLVMESVDIKMEPSSPATTPPPDMWCDDIKEETTMPSSPTPCSDMSCGDIKEETTPNSPMPSSVPANIDIKEEPSSPTTTLLPDVTCRDIEKEAVMRNSPPLLLSLVMESVDIKMEPSSPATTPPPDMSCGDIKEETTPNSPTPSSHPLDVARTPQTSSTETSRDAPVADSETGIPNGTSRAPVEKCGRGAGSSSHVCDVCGRGLSTKATLKRHHLSHMGERPYACSICDRRFALKSNVAKHYQFHKHGVKRHQCLQCNKLFMSSTALEEHQKRHNSKKRLYSCHVCPSSFMVKSQLDNHMLMHVQDDQWPRSCPVCKKCFSWWPSLITHMGQEHGGVENIVDGAGNSG